MWLALARTWSPVVAQVTVGDLRSGANAAISDFDCFAVFTGEV